VQYMQKTCKHGQDIAVSLRDLKQKDLQSLVPAIGQSTGTYPVANSNEQTGMDIMYQAELERYLERKDTLEQNLTKTYALIFSTYCNKTIQNRIEEHPDYETTICDEPIELLSKIKVLMHDLIGGKCLDKKSIVSTEIRWRKGLSYKTGRRARGYMGMCMDVEIDEIMSVEAPSWRNTKCDFDGCSAVVDEQDKPSKTNWQISSS
jgi:hypothetical protein